MADTVRLQFILVEIFTENRKIILVTCLKFKQLILHRVLYLSSIRVLRSFEFLLLWRGGLRASGSYGPGVV